MFGRRVYLILGVLLVIQFGWFDYSVITGEYWRNEHRTIGVPFSPWYESHWAENDWEGLGKHRFRFVSASFGLFVLGAVMLWSVWFTKDFVTELDAEERANASSPPPTEV